MAAIQQRDESPTEQTEAPKVQRWPSDAASKASQRTASSTSTASASNAAGGIRINGRSIVFDAAGTSGSHRRQASSSSIATTSVTTAHAIPGAFPSSYSSSGSLAGPSSPSLSAESTVPTTKRQVGRAPSFGAAGIASSGSRPGLLSTQKPSFLSQTLGRFTGAAAQVVQAHPSDPGLRAMRVRERQRRSEDRDLDVPHSIIGLRSSGNCAVARRGTDTQGDPRVNGLWSFGLFQRVRQQCRGYAEAIAWWTGFAALKACILRHSPHLEYHLCAVNHRSDTAECCAEKV